MARRLDRRINFDSLKSSDICEIEALAAETASASILDSELAILCRLWTISAELCTPLLVCDSIIFKTTLCSSIFDRDAAVPLSSLLSNFSSVLPFWFSLGNYTFFEDPTYLPRTIKLSSMACLCLSRSSRAFLKTSLLMALQNFLTQAFAPTSDAGRRELALSSKRPISVVQKSSWTCRAVIWESLKSSGNLATSCLAA